MKIVLPLALLTLAAPAYAAPLRSPWDLHPVRSSSAPYTCPAVPQLPRDFVTDGFYADNDPTHSIIDPVKQKEYNRTSGPVKHEGDVLVAAADAFRASGSQQAAACVITHLDGLARQQSLAGKMSSAQAYFVQGWVVGAGAIAFLKVDGAHRASADQKQRIFPWLQTIAEEVRDFYTERGKKEGGGAQNHFYWAAVQLAATAMVNGNRGDFDWAMQRARAGIDAIAPDGTLEGEMRRGSRALHYHLYAASPLVMLAELGMPNGVDLYSYRNGALKKLVEVSVAGLNDPTLFQQRTGIAQVQAAPNAEGIGWAEPYNRRFPSATLTRLLAAATDHSYMYLGGLPPP